MLYSLATSTLLNYFCSTTALKNLKSLALPASNGKQPVGTAAIVKLPATGKSQIPDCCICLFSVTIRQALFIAPCSHTFHYKCIRPLLESHHPAFSCPLCRTFADLEEDVEVEVEFEEAYDGEDAEAEAILDGKDPSGADIDRDVDSPQPDVSMAMEDNLPASRSTSGLAIRTEREAGAETEVEGDGQGLGVPSRARNGRRVASRVPGGSGDRASLSQDLDYLDEEMVVDAGEMGIIDANADMVDVDGTIGGKRKR